jgi:EAL domain-containing protein (putative c-di-GMP-specific phosphodiesterase class I)/GGDEF domain-containing protein
VTRPKATSRKALVVWGTYAVIVATGSALVLLSIPSTFRFLPEAPVEFWLLSILALLVELSPLTIPHQRRQPTRLAVSLSLTFAIMLLWGSAVAIVVQTLAVGVATLRERRPWTDFAFDAARFSLAFQAASWAEGRIGGESTLGVDVDEFGLATVLLVPLVWFLVDNGVIALILTAAGRASWRRWLGPSLYYYQAATAGLLMLAPALIVAPTGWAVALLAIPLALFGLVSRVLRAQGRDLNRDPSSQLQNIRGLADSVDRLLIPGSPTSLSPRLGLLLVRLSGLGDITNTFGRLVSEHLVDRVGELLTADTSSDAIIGRVASADIVVLLPKADLGHVQHVADRITRSLMAPIDVDGVVFVVRSTIGIATAPADGTELGTLTAQAERAIMEARRTGAMVRTIPAGDEVEARRRLSLLTDLRASIEQPEHADELYVLYQPQVRIEDGHVIGVEALVRWRHPDRGLVDTTDMILTAEASGVIQLLTLRVLDDVLAQLDAWKAAGLRLRVSVNASAKDFASRQFADQVQRRLIRHAVGPEELELEITESALVTASPSVDRTVADLVAMGVGLSLDDFGTGFASLQQIRRYPLSELKIDRSYVAAITTSQADRAMVTAISQLAFELGLRVVAEGIEDAGTAQLLDEIGPIIGQGWHFGHPMPGPDLVAWIHARPDRT